ncbi:MAG: choice-of-anchor D domain-containing protein [Myxococcota bacterium]
MLQSAAEVPLRPTLSGVLLTLVIGCSEYDFTEGVDLDGGPQPDIRVTPSTLAFGLLSSRDAEVQALLIENVGTAALEVDDVAVDIGFAFTVLDIDGPVTLAPAEQLRVDVSFTPTGADENLGWLVVTSDDRDTPEVGVSLTGSGGLPELVITPSTHVFADVQVPCEDEVTLELRNVGHDVLVIDEWSYLSRGQLALADDAPEFPIELAHDETQAVTVVHAPTRETTDAGVFEVVSNDPRGVLIADQIATATYAGTTTEVFTEPGEVVPLDVMMLIDHSCSMYNDNADDVERGIPDFVAGLQAAADWQLLQVTREDGCANGGVIDPSTPDAAQYLIDHAWDELDGQGGGGFGGRMQTEALLELASDALDQTGPGSCNAGFGREGALLHVITISDEPEQSGHDPEEQRPVTHQQHQIRVPQRDPVGLLDPPARQHPHHRQRVHQRHQQVQPLHCDLGRHWTSLRCRACW